MDGIINLVIIMNINIYKLSDVNLPTAIAQTKNVYSLYDEEKKEDIILRIMTLSKIRDSYVNIIICKNFMDLTIKFTLSDIIMLIEQGIYLYILADPNFSTFTLQEDEFKFDSKETIKTKLSVLKAVSTAQTAQAKNGSVSIITQDFVNDYWDWQTEKISVKQIMNRTDRSYSFDTTAQFYSIAKRYEFTDDYLFMQDKLAKELIKYKKHGKVDKKIMADFFTKHRKEYLTSLLIQELMDIMKATYLDFWRSLRNFYASKNFRDLEDSLMKRCLNNVINVLNSDFSDFFADCSSVMLTYTDNYAETIKTIMKEMDEIEATKISEENDKTPIDFF